jgi:hypothetical protein
MYNDLLPRSPAIDDIQVDHDADDNPPRLAIWRSVFIRDGVLAVGTSRRIFRNWPLAVRARNRCLFVRVVVIVPFFIINDAPAHSDVLPFRFIHQQPVNALLNGRLYVLLFGIRVLLRKGVAG